MNIIGHNLSGQDNDTYMFDEDDPSLERCRSCGYRLNFQAFNPKYRLGKKGRAWDIGSTYDGQLIVSRKFKEVCTKNKIPGIQFSSFDSEPDHFHIVATRELEIDPDRSKLRFGKKCPVCGNFDSVVGPFRYFRVDSPLTFGFFRSNLALASGNAKSPLLIVSLDVHDLVKRADLIGVEFSPVQGIEAQQ